MFLEGPGKNGGRIMITCDFVFVVVDGKRGTAGLSKVRFSNSASAQPRILFTNSHARSENSFTLAIGLFTFI